MTNGICALLGMIVAIAIFFGCRFLKNLYIKLSTVNITSNNVIGEVIKQEHVHSYAGNREAYLTWVKWNSIEQLFDDKDLFSRYRVGNQIKLTLVKKLDKNEKLLEQTLKPRSC